MERKIAPKDEVDFTPEEDTISSKNSWTLNAIFNLVRLGLSGKGIGRVHEKF